ncbi:MAG: thioesterase family protein [Pseudomonadota bacterium]
MTGWVWSAEVLADWVDYNGHMRDAYYGLAFSYAVDDVMVQVGMDATYRALTNCTLYVIEDHKVYLEELHEAVAFDVRSTVIDHDAKRIVLRQEMWADLGLRAVCESVQLHVSQAGGMPKAAEMPDAIQARVAAGLIPAAERDAQAHKARALGLRR